MSNLAQTSRGPRINLTRIETSDPEHDHEGRQLACPKGDLHAEAMAAVRRAARGRAFAALTARSQRGREGQAARFASLHFPGSSGKKDAQRLANTTVRAGKEV